MTQEDKKFLDLDMVANQIPYEDDQSLFKEAVNCYYAGSHRAAAILAWYATANCLKRRIYELKNEGDGIAQQEALHLSPIGEGVVGEEEQLINSARACELIDDFEEKSLRFARDMRNKCAHPTGVIPPAEAIRHVLYISSQYVLGRRGYRGISYITDIVTNQFDDSHFLANRSMAQQHCREMIERVPSRLWPQFIKLAAENRAASHTETWRENAHQFFQQLLKQVDDSMVEELTISMQLFEADAPDFFATLVGIDNRVVQFWDHHKRSQIRARLRQTSVVKMRTDEIHSWAIICAQDGLDQEDIVLIQDKFITLARFLAQEEELLQRQKIPIIQIIEQLIQDDTTSSTTASGCKYLFSTVLFKQGESDEFSQRITSIIDEIIRRFLRDNKHRELVENIRKWSTPLLAQFLKSSQLFWLECSEDNPEDVVVPFVAREELENRNPLAVPQEFQHVIGLILNKELLPEWLSEQSSAGGIFLAQLTDYDFNAHGLDRSSFEDASTEPNDFWWSRLGVLISSQQDQLLKVVGMNEDGTQIAEVANILNVLPEDIESDINYLILQGMLVQQNERYKLREDLQALIVEAQE